VFVLTITNTNRPPTLNTIPNQTVAENALLSFTATASDPDLVEGDVLTWSLASNPAGSTINTSNGLFQWTPDYDAAETNGGHYNGVQVTVTDAHGAFSTKSFDITVTDTNRPPVVAAINDTTIMEYQTLVVTPNGSDPDLDA